MGALLTITSLDKARYKLTFTDGSVWHLVQYSSHSCLHTMFGNSDYIVLSSRGRHRFLGVARKKKP